MTCLLKLLLLLWRGYEHYQAMPRCPCCHERHAIDDLALGCCSNCLAHLAPQGVTA